MGLGCLSCKWNDLHFAITPTCDSHTNWNITTTRSQNKHKNRIREFSFTELESATDGFSPHAFLGRGSHGTVYRAILDGGNLIAAVKKTKRSSNLENEIEILFRVRSNKIVNLIGFAADSERKWIVLELMPNGSLFDLIHINSNPPNWTLRLRIALQIAEAVRSLHRARPSVIHRDIKSSNVLLDSRWNARLSDFGFAIARGEEGKHILPAGTLGYLDPYYLVPADLSNKSDVFSFGILLLEVISGRKAIDLSQTPSSVVDWALPLIKHGEFTAIRDPRIRTETNLIREVSILAARCVEMRPPMEEVVECLKDVCRKVHAPNWKMIRRRVRESVMKRGRKNKKVSSCIVRPIVECKEIQSMNRCQSAGSGRRMDTLHEDEIMSLAAVGLRRSRSMGTLNKKSDDELPLMHGAPEVTKYINT